MTDPIETQVRAALDAEANQIDVTAPSLGDLYNDAGRSRRRSFGLLGPAIAIGALATVAAVGLYVTAGDDQSDVIANVPTTAVDDTSVPTTATSVPDAAVNPTSTTTAEVTTSVPTPTDREVFVFYDGKLLGAWNNGWVDEPEDLDMASRTLVQPLEKTFTTSDPIEYAPGTFELQPWCENLDGDRFELKASDPLLSPITGISVTDADWPLYPRPVDDIGTSQAHKAAVVEALAAIGLDIAEPTITRTVRVDIDGDGTDEVILEARSGEPHFVGSRIGDYSIVLVRKLDVLTGDVVSIVLGADATTGNEEQFEMPPEPQPGVNDGLVGVNSVFYELTDLSDVNGDGAYEIIINAYAWESDSNSIFTIEGNSPTRRISVGCGL